MKATYGYTKHGVGRAYTGVKGLSALIAIASAPGSAPVIAGTFAAPDLTTFCRLDEIGLRVVGPRVDPD